MTDTTFPGLCEIMSAKTIPRLWITTRMSEVSWRSFASVVCQVIDSDKNIS